MFPILEQSVQTLIYYTCLAQRAADLAYVRHSMLTARFKHCSVGKCAMHQILCMKNIERKISSIKYSSSLVVFRKSRPSTLSCYFLIAKSSLYSRKTSTFCKCTKVTGTSPKSCYPLTEYLHQSSHHEMYWWHMPLKVLLVWLCPLLTFIMIFHCIKV